VFGKKRIPPTPALLYSLYSVHSMRFTSRSAIVAVSFLNACFLFAEPPLVLPNATVGSNLEAPAKIKLDEPAPDEGLEITLRSADPNLLRISTSANKLGTASLVIKARPGNVESQEFWLQALGSSGSVTYTANAPGRGGGTGTVTLAPSGILVRGPYRVLKFQTTTGAAPPPKITLIAARLDSSMKLSEVQAVASDVQVEVSNSNTSAGRLADSPVTISAGEASAVTLFQSAGEGDVTFAIKAPPGFSVPAESATVTASVRKPGIVVSDDLVIGENLQIGGTLALGELAPASGLTVTLTSADPSRLLIAASGTEAGSKSLQIKMRPEGFNATYFLQALGSSGEVEYTASAPGYRSRTGVVKLAPSGIIMTPYFQGPPDEAQVLKKVTSDGSYGFRMKESEQTPMKLIVWTAQLDPKTHRSADITVQPLRAGLSLTVPLTNSNPGVGKMASEITITGGSDHGSVEFTAASAGMTEISVVTPANFTVSANSTKVNGTVVSK
jgi:hypothetical protein